MRIDQNNDHTRITHKKRFPSLNMFNVTASKFIKLFKN